MNGKSSKSIVKNKQDSLLGKDSFIDFTVLVCIFLFLDDKIFINLLILRMSSKRQILGSKITKFTSNAKKMVFCLIPQKDDQSLHILVFLSILFILPISISKLCDDHLNCESAILHDSLFKLLRIGSNSKWPFYIQWYSNLEELLIKLDHSCLE